MNVPAFSLSVEEVAYTMGYLGDAEVAAGFLKSIVGDLPSDNLTGRITAASHSLIARGLLELDLQTGNHQLDPEFGQAVTILLRSRVSLRLDLAAPEQPVRTVSLFQSETGTVVHELTQGVTSQFTLYDPEESLAPLLVAKMPTVPRGSGESEPLGRLSGAQLQLIRQRARQAQPEELLPQLTPLLNATVAEVMSRTLTRDAVIWASILQLDIATAGAQPTIEADQGLFIALLPGEVMWLFASAPDDARYVDLYRADAALLADLIGALAE